MKAVWIVSAKRTVHGRFLRSLTNHLAVDVGLPAARASLDGMDSALINSVVADDVLSAGSGMNVVQQIGIFAGLPVGTPAHGAIPMAVPSRWVIPLDPRARVLLVHLAHRQPKFGMATFSLLAAWVIMFWLGNGPEIIA